MFETDDDDFMPSPSSKLSSIFSTSSISDGSNASLKYKAPKQPKPPNGSSKPAEPEANGETQLQGQSSVVLAQVVTLWKLDNGKNKTLGKYMVAIIGNTSKDLFEIIVYQDKTKIIIRETLGSSLALYKYPNSFVAFYDRQKQLWNLSFESLSSKGNFLQYAVKYNCTIIDQNEQNILRDESDSAVNNNSLTHEVDKTEIVSNEPNKDSSSKEKILSRITKMGHSILPRTADRSRSSDLSDSETESSDSRPLKPVTAPKKFKRNVNHEKALTPVTVESNNSNFMPHIPQTNNFLLPNNQMMRNTHNTGLMYSQPLPDYGMSNFIIAQNAELKSNLAEISMKLNNVLSMSDSNGNNKENLGTLTSKIKCQNLKIDNLSTDVERSRKALEDLRRRYDEKCAEVIDERNKRDHLENLEQEVIILREKVQHMDALQSEVEQVQTELKQKDKKIEIQSLKLKDFEDYYKVDQSTKDNLSRENKELKLKLEEATLKANKSEEEMNGKEKQDENLELDKDKVNKIIKESMNDAFGSIMENFDENGVYEFRDIQGVLLENLKKTSYRLMDSLL